MLTSNLNTKDIQVFDLAPFFPQLDAGRLFMVYAPLAGSCFLADADTVQQLDRGVIDSGACEERIRAVVSQICDISEYSSMLASPDPTVVLDPSNYTKLSILPNLKCNFSCRYCYSAKGRSTTVLDAGKMMAMLDYFIDSKRVKSDSLTIFISGGGEPLLSWDLVLSLIRYSRQRAADQGCQLELLLMTNGSLLTPEIACHLRDNDVNVGVSFEILPDIQNSQRGSYDTVSKAIRMLSDYQVQPSLSSVITPSNVERMMEMAETVVRDFPAVRHLNFDPAMSCDLFPTTQSLRDFYKLFVDNFFAAKRYCGEHHITLDCNAVRRVAKLFPRYCQGKLCLVPSGEISVCHTVSSPKEYRYADYIYGEVVDGRVVFDKDKFSMFVAPENYLLDQCRSCIARWHCGGGCLMYRRNYDNDRFEAVCEFTRTITAKTLLANLDAAFRQRYNYGVESIVSQYFLQATQ